MPKNMYTYKVRINGSEPLHRTIKVMAESETIAMNLAILKINREWGAVFSPGKDILQLELVQTI